LLETPIYQLDLDQVQLSFYWWCSPRWRTRLDRARTHRYLCVYVERSGIYSVEPKIFPDTTF